MGKEAYYLASVVESTINKTISSGVNVSVRSYVGWIFAPQFKSYLDKRKL